MPIDLNDKLKQWQRQHGVALSPEAYASLLKMASDSMAAAPYRLTMRSGVAPRNDNIVGDFYDERTAYLVGSLLKALDENDHPEYRGFDVRTPTADPDPAPPAGPRA